MWLWEGKYLQERWESCSEIETGWSLALGLDGKYMSPGLSFSAYKWKSIAVRPRVEGEGGRAASEWVTCPHHVCKLSNSFTWTLKWFSSYLNEIQRPSLPWLNLPNSTPASVPSLTLYQPHWPSTPPCCNWNQWHMLLPQVRCTFCSLCLSALPPPTHMVNSLAFLALQSKVIQSSWPSLKGPSMLESLFCYLWLSLFLLVFLQNSYQILSLSLFPLL